MTPSETYTPKSMAYTPFLWGSEQSFLRAEEPFWPVADCKSLREAPKQNKLRKISMDDKGPKITVVNLLLVIFRCGRLAENYNKNTEPNKTIWLFVWHANKIIVSPRKF